MTSRVLESLCYFVISALLLVVSMRVGSINLRLFFGLMSAMFFLAVFRPRVRP